MRRRVFLHGLTLSGVAAAFPGWGPGPAGNQTKAWARHAARRIRTKQQPPQPTKPSGPLLADVGAALGLRLTRFEDSRAIDNTDAPFPAQGGTTGAVELTLKGTSVECVTRVKPAGDRRDAVDLEAVFRVGRGRLPNAAVAVTLTLNRWSRDAYALIPGAVYAGNRFASRRIPFPPLPAEPSDIGPHVPPIISDIPRLNNQSGESRIALSSVDAAAPAIAVRVVAPTSGGPVADQGFVLLAEPMTTFGPTSLGIWESEDRSTAVLSIGAPCVRPDLRYGLCNSRVPSLDRGADLEQGETVTLRLRLLSFLCPDVQTLFDRWYEARRDRVGPAKLRHELPLSVASRMVEERLLADQWRDTMGVFTTRAPTVLGAAAATAAGAAATAAGAAIRLESTFGTGADGAMALAVPSMLTGDATARRRARAVLDFQLTGQTRCGLFHTSSNGAAWWDEGDAPPPPEGEIGAATGANAGNNAGGVVGAASSRAGAARIADPRAARPRRWTHVGRNAETLYLACREVLFLRKADQVFKLPENWRGGIARAADAFVKLWSRHRQLGQYLNSETGDVVIGGSTAGALVPAALLLAGRVLETEDYLSCAREAAESFHAKFVEAGLTLGGAPAALQCPDSRSAAGLLESFVALADATGDDGWYDRAAAVTHQLATWVVAWDVPFPARSTLGRMDVRTTGAVLVSAQDKWATPGFVGMSADALLRLYRATGRLPYLELLRETIHNSSGYVDPEDRRPETDTKSGWVVGRIPLGDALGAPGDVPEGTPSGGAQATCLGGAVEVPSIYVQPDTGLAFSFDHVDVRVTKRSPDGAITIAIHNPTRFDAELRILSETEADRKRPLEMFAVWALPVMTLAPDAREEVQLPGRPA